MSRAKDRISKETPDLPSVEFISDIERVSQFVLGLSGVYLDLKVDEMIDLSTGAKLVRKDDITFRLYGYDEKIITINDQRVFADLGDSLMQLISSNTSDSWEFIYV